MSQIIFLSTHSVPGTVLSSFRMIPSCHHLAREVGPDMILAGLQNNK